MELHNVFMLKLRQNFCFISDTFPHQTWRDKIFLIHPRFRVVHLMIVFLLQQSLFVYNFNSVIPTVFDVFCAVDQTETPFPKQLDEFVVIDPPLVLVKRF